MKEELLHFIWKYQLFDKHDLISEDGEEVEIQYPGIHNFDSGPDFSNARVKIGDQIWVGNIEIHIKASDWLLHQHQSDQLYKTVILHVVFDNDTVSETQTNIPVVSLKNRIKESTLTIYKGLMGSLKWIACEDLINKADRITRFSWQSRMIAERLEKRYFQISEMLDNSKNDWHESFYHSVARSFGYRVNADTFEKLAQSLPLKIISWHKSNLLQIEALLFGQSGLLNSKLKDKYPVQLKKEYDFLKKKYNLSPLTNIEWKFARMRPVSFPTIRISQFANLLYKSSNLFSLTTEIEKSADLYNFFYAEASSYWINHYRFDEESSEKVNKKLGKSTIDRILINTVIPFLFTYGKLKNKPELSENAITFLDEIPAEKNQILERWKELGFRNNTAGDSQALIQLKNEYCDKKKCLNCGIGIKILQ